MHLTMRSTTPQTFKACYASRKQECFQENDDSIAHTRLSLLAKFQLELSPNLHLANDRTACRHHHQGQISRKPHERVLRQSDQLPVLGASPFRGERVWDAANPAQSLDRLDDTKLLPHERSSGAPGACDGDRGD